MLLKYLDKEKFENILVCSQDFHEEDYRDLVDSFEQVEMTRAIGGNDLKAIKEVRTLIKKYNPDIVYAHSSKAGAIARVADIGLKNHCVYNPHEKMLGLVLKALKIDEPVQYIPRYILLLLFIYTVLPTFIKTTVVFNYITWFSIVYIVAAYIRLYPKKWYSDNYTVSICLIVSVILSWISVVVLAFICFKTGKEIQNCYYFVSDSNKLLALSTAVFSFLFFDNIKMKYHKFINVVAASTFGVLQIHTSSDTMRTWLWKTVCDNVGAYDTSHWLLHVVVCVVMVFFVCTLIDIVRINILEVPFLEWLNKKMADNRMERH